jgi:hypothetical protein
MGRMLVPTMGEVLVEGPRILQEAGIFFLGGTRVEMGDFVAQIAKYR